MAGTKHFSRMNYSVLRGMRELLSHRGLSNPEWLEVRDFFENVCAFCGCEDTGNPRTGLVPGHLIAAVEYGEFCLGNVAPSCQDCNDHRGKKEWRTYLQTEFADDAEARVQRIEQYLDNYPYRLTDNLHQYLTDEETAEYWRLIQAWEAVWRDSRSLRDRINARRRSEKT